MTTPCSPDHRLSCANIWSASEATARIAAKPTPTASGSCWPSPASVSRTRPSLLHIEQLDACAIEAFLIHIEQERGNGAVTRNVRLAAIKSFMHYVEYRVPSLLEQVGQIYAIPTKRHEQKLVQHLTMDEVRAILNAPDITTRLGIRIGRCCIFASRQDCVSPNW